MPSVYDNPNAEFIENDFNSMYSRYSESDLSFLHNSPAKSELLNTEIGKKFARDEQKKYKDLKEQTAFFATIQKSATVDDRFSELHGLLDKKNCEDLY